MPLCRAYRSSRRSLRSIVKVVGAIGFEPTTSWSQTRRSTKLSYTPMFLGLFDLLAPDFRQRTYSSLPSTRSRGWSVSGLGMRSNCGLRKPVKLLTAPCQLTLLCAVSGQRQAKVDASPKSAAVKSPSVPDRRCVWRSIFDRFSQYMCRLAAFF